MMKTPVVIAAAFLLVHPVFSQGQFAGLYKGQVFLKTITSGVESQEIPQGSVNLVVDGQGKIVSEGVNVLTGQVDNAGDIVFEENGFFFKTGKIVGNKMRATGTLVNEGQTLIYRLEADLSVSPPEINKQPESRTVIAGAKVTFNVSVRNAGTFQWRKDGVDIEGATGSSLTLEAVTADDAGTYTVVITNETGSVTSGGAVLTVTPASENPSWHGRQFRKIADTNTEVPDGEGTFSEFRTPYLGEDGAYFVHRENLDQIGIYGYSDAGLFKIADRGDTTKPDGFPYSYALHMGPNTNAGEVILSGWLDPSGVYRWSDGEFSLLLDSTAEIPGSDGIFGGGTPIYGNGRLLFEGFTGGVNPVVSQGFFILEEGELRQAPGLEDDAVVASSPLDYDGESFAVIGNGPLAYRGVFASFEGGPLLRIFDTTENFPGTEIRMNTFHRVQIDGGWVYSGAQGSSGGFLIRGNGVQTEVLVGPDTRMPNGVLGKLVSPAFSDLDADAGRVFFTAGSNRGAYGIFSWADGELKFLFDREDRFDGRAPKTYRLWPHCVRGEDMLIQVNFDFVGNDAALYTTKALGATPAENFSVTGFDLLKNGYAQLTLETPPAKQYRVQYSENLVDWMDAASVIQGNGFEQTWTDDGPPETESPRGETSSRFYRVVELP